MAKGKEGFFSKLFGKKKNCCCEVVVEEIDSETNPKETATEPQSECCENTTGGEK